MSSPRVRQVLSSLSPSEVKALKKCLPADMAPMPDVTTSRYPTAILAAFPKPTAYADLGNLAEALLKLPAGTATVEACVGNMDAADAEAAPKVRKSKTTTDFLTHITETRRRLELTFATGDTPVYEPEVGDAATLVGHPDIVAGSKIYEVKLTGQLKQNWQSFLFQVFAYAALVPTATDVYLVLPLQEHVWHHDVRGWTQRGAFLAILQAVAGRLSGHTHTGGVSAADTNEAESIIREFRIGSHQSRDKSLVGTIKKLRPGVPAQIFLSSPQSSQIRIAEEELTATRAAIEATGAHLFVHAPYVINLAAVPEGDYQVVCLQKTCAAATAMGALGVVVHVGKHTTQDPTVALQNMRDNIAKILPHATAECPLLLETPAGQGTEMLRSYEEFVGFVQSFQSARFRICMDTCHVFACGHDPVAFTEKALAEPPIDDHRLLTLVHFNDSQDVCGACKDRHTLVGTGQIGAAPLRKVAELCLASGVPCVIE